MVAHEEAKQKNLWFPISCWVMAGVVLIQLWIGGVALALRVESARDQEVREKIVTKVVRLDARSGEDDAVRPATDEPQAPGRASPGRSTGSGPLVALPPMTDRGGKNHFPQAESLKAPAIADPVVERLVEEARAARVAEDMGKAMIKLQAAREREPAEPNVLYELGLVYETMAAYDEALVSDAAEAFQEVFNLGASGAGALYPLAAKKLRDGISRPMQMSGKLRLGQVQIFRDQEHELGERVVLTIPVLAAPGHEPEADDFFVHVQFYNRYGEDDPVPAGIQTEKSYDWVSGDFDWLGGEERLRVTYVIPEESASNTRLFGRLRYYGQEVKLIYKNRLIDRQAWPRHLGADSETRLSRGHEPQFLDHEFDPRAPLLPPLEDERLDSSSSFQPED